MFDLDEIAPERTRPLRRVEYERLVDLGHFEDEKVELLYGVIVEMSPRNIPHDFAVQQLTALLVPALLGRAVVRVQSSFAALEFSQPEPDLVVAPLENYRLAHPSQALLVIEASESSLRKDRRVKAGLYAACEIPEYWIVNLIDEVVEIHRAPVEGRYTQVTTAGRGQSISPAAFPDVQIRVSEILT